MGGVPPWTPPPPPPLRMFEADSQNFASAPSVPRGFELHNFRPAFGGDHRETQGGGCVPAKPPSPPFRPPPSNTSLAQCSSGGCGILAAEGRPPSVPHKTGATVGGTVRDGREAGGRGGWARGYQSGRGGGGVCESNTLVRANIWGLWWYGRAHGVCTCRRRGVRRRPSDTVPSAAVKRPLPCRALSQKPLFPREVLERPSTAGGGGGDPPPSCAMRSGSTDSRIGGAWHYSACRPCAGQTVPHFHCPPPLVTAGGTVGPGKYQEGGPPQEEGGGDTPRTPPPRVRCRARLRAPRGGPRPRPPRPVCSKGSSRTSTRTCRR